MAYQHTSGRDLSPLALWGAGEPFAQLDHPSMAPVPETDLGELAATFAASRGPSLSPDLAMDLALQMVLHEIVDRACVSTAGTGAAIALYHDGELICRASHGTTAPPLGSRLDLGVGLSGECMRTGRIQLCNDVQTDLRVDFEVCSQWGVHSVVVLPLLRAGKITGIFEVLSSRPSAFGEGDIGRLEALADRILKNLERAAELSAPPAKAERLSSGSDHVADPQLLEGGQAERGRRWTDIATWALAIVVLACVGWLSLRVVQRLAWQKAAVPRPAAGVKSSATAVKTSANSSTANNDAAVGSRTSSSSPVALSKPAARNRSDASRSAEHTASRAAEGSLRVYENGREVFHMPPSAVSAEAPTETGVVPASSVQTEKVLELSASAAEADLIYRVEPEYPEEARLQGIQGAVVLEVHIRPDGGVEQVKIVSGEPVLASAAMTAVRQWRFTPRQVDGQPAEMQTTITLNFRLPS